MVLQKIGIVAILVVYEMHGTAVGADEGVVFCKLGTALRRSESRYVVRERILAVFSEGEVQEQHFTVDGIEARFTIGA